MVFNLKSLKIFFKLWPKFFLKSKLATYFLRGLLWSCLIGILNTDFPYILIKYFKMCKFLVILIAWDQLIKGLIKYLEDLIDFLWIWRTLKSLERPFFARNTFNLKVSNSNKNSLYFLIKLCRSLRNFRKISINFFHIITLNDLF